MADVGNTLIRTCALLLLCSSVVGAQTPSALPTVETVPVPTSGDAADDMVIWVHPTQPSQSLVIGTDKDSGLLVYDLTGKELQYLPDGELNNVDLRGGFALGGKEVTLVTSGERSRRQLAIYALDPDTRTLYPVAARGIDLNIPVYGSCMYQSRLTGETYFICTSEDGDVQQWRLFPSTSGTKVDAELVRSFDVGSQSEGCVADDELGYLYVGEEAKGIWRYGAEPGAGSARTSIDTTSSGGHLKADVEGLAIYSAPGGTGYLIASSQGNNTFVVYERRPPHAHRLTFTIGANSALGIDAVSETDGIDVSSAPLGSAFPGGLFAAQDGVNTGAKQNFKFVPWQSIAGLANPPLLGATTAAPDAAFSASPSGTALEIAFADQSTGNVTAWTWDFGDGAGSAAQSPVHAYARAGSYTVLLTVKGPDGSDSARAVVDVQSNAPKAAFRSSPSATDPHKITFTDQSTGAVTAWAWDFGDGASSSGQSPVHTYASAGSYAVLLTVKGPGGSDSTRGVVDISTGAPKADFRSSPADTEPRKLTFTDASTGTVTAWAWDFGDGTSTNQRSPVHVYAEDGTFTVRLKVTGPGGSDSTEATVEIDSDTTGSGSGASGGGGSSGGGCFATLGPDGRSSGGDPSLMLSLALVLATLALRRARLNPRAQGAVARV